MASSTRWSDNAPRKRGVPSEASSQDFRPNRNPTTTNPNGVPGAVKSADAIAKKTGGRADPSTYQIGGFYHGETDFDLLAERQKISGMNQQDGVEAADLPVTADVRRPQ